MDSNHIPGYAVLRDGLSWEAQITNLEVGADGSLGLTAVPGPAGGVPIHLPGPYDIEPSGLALGECLEIYLADTAGNRVLWDDRLCGVRRINPGRQIEGCGPGTFVRPRGLLLQGAEVLYVADSGRGRVQVLRPDTLERRSVWAAGLEEPTGLAADSQGRVYVLDRGLRGVLRFSPAGAPDHEYNEGLASQVSDWDPGFLTIDRDDLLYVSDPSGGLVWRFGPGGLALDPLPAEAGESPALPGALAAWGDRLYVACRQDGRIWVFSLPEQAYLGWLPGFLGPAAALAVSASGDLYVKTDLAEGYLRLEARLGYVQAGDLTAGPLDAGQRLGWARLKMDSSQPEGTSLSLEFYTAADPDQTPGEGDWPSAPADDFLIPPLPAAGGLPAGPPRFLWVRVRFESESGTGTPRLHQLSAETPGEDYLDYLPAIYAVKDAADGTLQKILAWFRSELGDLELGLDDLHRLFDPQAAPPGALPWLGRWLAAYLPPGWSADQQRALLQMAFRLHARRGTLAGLADYIEVYTGYRPLIVESYRHRRLWILGQSSNLGADTGLAPDWPDGMVVPEGAPPACDLEEDIVGGRESENEGQPAGIPEIQPLAHEPGWSEPEGLVIGDVVVGAGGPLEAASFGEPLFAGTAHHFTVFAPAYSSAARRQALIDLIEAEKPAHTDYHLCFVEARMRVGFQARLGIDAVVAGPPDPLVLDGAATGLGFDTSLGAAPGQANTSRAGQDARLGRNLVIQ
jgi:phage tail-like protein